MAVKKLEPDEIEGELVKFGYFEKASNIWSIFN